MSDLIWLSKVQMRPIEPHFPLSHGVPRVDDRRVVSAITFVTRKRATLARAPATKCRAFMLEKCESNCMGPECPQQFLRTDKKKLVQWPKRSSSTQFELREASENRQGCTQDCICGSSPRSC